MVGVTGDRGDEGDEELGLDGQRSMAMARRRVCVAVSSAGEREPRKSAAWCGALVPLVVRLPRPSIVEATPSVTADPPTDQTVGLLTERMVANFSASLLLRLTAGANGSPSSVSRPPRMNVSFVGVSRTNLS